MAMEPYRSALRVFWIVDNIVQRKVLTPAVADSLGELEARLLAFEAECRCHPRPVRWKFTREEFDRRLLELQPSIQQLAV